LESNELRLCVSLCRTGCRPWASIARFHRLERGKRAAKLDVYWHEHQREIVQWRAQQRLRFGERVRIYPMGIADTWARARRLARIVVGFTLLGIGGLLLALPGPGWLTIVLGLAVLATEFVWARRLLDRFKRGAARVGKAAGAVAHRRNRDVE
jgi:hypothetical protein